jgi:hypothetical protein
MKKKNRAERLEADGVLPEETVVPSPTAAELATLAARIDPGLCQQRPTEAIKAAIALIEAANKTIDLKRMERELEKATEQMDNEQADDPNSPFHFKYQRGVKLITGEKRRERALSRFRAFLGSQEKTKGTIDQLLTEYRQNGFTGGKISHLREEFATWKAEEKSRMAKQSRAQRKGRQGRVKSKDDKRLGARPPS